MTIICLNPVMQILFVNYLAFLTSAQLLSPIHGKECSTIWKFLLGQSFQFAFWNVLKNNYQKKHKENGNSCWICFHCLFIHTYGRFIVKSSNIQCTNTHTFSYCFTLQHPHTYNWLRDLPADSHFLTLALSSAFSSSLATSFSLLDPFSSLFTVSEVSFCKRFYRVTYFTEI